MGTLGNSVDKYVTGRMLRTSNDRRWSHLLAEIWSHEAGELPPQLPRDTEIAIQLRGHSLVDRRGAGMHQRTLSKKGTEWLCPAGNREATSARRGRDATIAMLTLPPAGLGRLKGLKGMSRWRV